MANIRSIDQISKKFAEVTPLRTGDYEAGIANPRRDWATATAAAEGAYEEGLRESMTKKRFGKGVKRAGSAEWQKRSNGKRSKSLGPWSFSGKGQVRKELWALP